MQSTYHVQRAGESLIARLIENGERSIELTYRNAAGDKQVGIYKDGGEVSTDAILANGRHPILKDIASVDTVLIGYQEGYSRLGPELMEQIPPDWHQVIGRWLAPKE